MKDRIKVMLDIPKERLMTHPQRIDMLIKELEEYGYVGGNMKCEREIVNDALVILKYAVQAVRTGREMEKELNCGDC